jgi:shikimate kinase
MENEKQKNDAPDIDAVVLIGPKHSGKTSVGITLAPLLGGEFADLDVCIERRAGKGVRVLFRESPENFRRAEAEALSSLLAETAPGTARVIASGGGLVDNEAALELLRRQGPRAPAVYLDVPAETAWARISAEAAKTGELPPFLDTGDPRQTHRLLHESRAAKCRKIAALVVNARDKYPDAIAEEIFGRIGKPTHRVSRPEK